MDHVSLGAGDASEEVLWQTPPPMLVVSTAPLDNGSWRDGVRIIAGPTGAGKTRLLRHLAATRHRYEGDIVEVETHPLYGRTLHSLSDRGPQAGENLEFWQAAWRTAILCSVASVLTERGSGLDDAARSDLARIFAFRHRDGTELLPPSGSVSLPYGQLSALVQRSASIAFFYDDRWNDIEATLASILAKGPHIEFFLESAESAWETEPFLALKCLHGLTREVLRLTEVTHPLASAVSVTLAVRNLVVADLYRAPAGGGFRASKRVAALAWSSEELIALFSQRVALVPDSLLLVPEATDPATRLTGLSTITVPERDGVSEPTSHYVVRHCAGTPRDVINIANSLLEEVQRLKSPKERALPESVVRQRVAVESHAIGTELLNQASTSLRSFDRRCASVSPDDYADQLVLWLSDFESDHVSRDELRAHLPKWADDRTRNVLPELLWRTGILGHVTYEQGRGTVRYFESRQSFPTLVGRDIALRMHPSMIEVADVTPSRELVSVFPGRQFDEEGAL
jgi:energy-coupling factor transporter ATP-binding protein EcfA2